MARLPERDHTPPACFGPILKCSTCGVRTNHFYFYNGHPYCICCAHNLTHLYHLAENEIPCPVVDGRTNELIPFGMYPNIDWS